MFCSFIATFSCRTSFTGEILTEKVLSGSSPRVQQLRVSVLLDMIWKVGDKGLDIFARQPNVTRDKATDKTCPFFMERNNKQHITQLLDIIRTRRLEGFENPFGLTKVRRSSSSTNSYDYDSSASARKHVVRPGGNYPTQFLVEQRSRLNLSDEESLRLASSSDSLFRRVPDISHSQAMHAAPSGPQDNNPLL